MKSRNNPKEFTALDYCFPIALIVIGLISFLLLLGTVGLYEHDLITRVEYWSRVIPSSLVFFGSTYLFVKLYIKE